MCVLGKLRSARKFFSDQDGSVTAFTVASMLGMILSTGMAVDFMRHEMKRTALQDAVDRGVLAAASASQGFDATQTVAGYLRAANWVPADVALAVDDTPLNGSRHVSATVSYTMKTFFLKMIGLKEIDVVVGAAAAERKPRMEMVLVLDVSSSMAREKHADITAAEIAALNAYPHQDALGWGGDPMNVSRLDMLRIAASAFVDDVLAQSPDTAISIVPFAGSVNPGATVFGALATGRDHGYSSCIEFTDADMMSADLPPALSRGQVPHFHRHNYWGVYNDPFQDWGWCPIEGQEITYVSNDAAALKSRIATLRTYDATAPQIGMKWAVGLLNPNSDWLVDTLIAAGDVDPRFAGLPVAYDDSDTIKTIVVMTDGEVLSQQRPLAELHDTPEGVVTLASRGDGLMNDGGSDAYYIYVSGQGTNGNGELTDAQVVDTDWASTAAAQFSDLCETAKAEGVQVFSIRFGTDVDPTRIGDCASSPSHFYDVAGSDIGAAFSGVSSALDRLKLVM